MKNGYFSKIVEISDYIKKFSTYANISTMKERNFEQILVVICPKCENQAHLDEFFRVSHFDK